MLPLQRRLCVPCFRKCNRWAGGGWQRRYIPRRKYEHVPTSEAAKELARQRRHPPQRTRAYPVATRADIDRKLRRIDELNLGRRGALDDSKFTEESFSLQFLGAAKTAESFLPEGIPEVAVIGRSNVGKSSFVNALGLNRIARTSPKPGMTQTLNWYLYDKRLHVIDLPGYGFSFAKPHVKENWERTVQSFFQNRRGIKRVFLLADARHGLKSVDMEMLQLLSSHKQTHQVVLTKADLVKPEELAHKWLAVEQKLLHMKYAIPEAVVISAKHRRGFSSLHAVFQNIAGRSRE